MATHRITTRCGWIVDRDQVAECIRPVRKVTRSLFQRWNADRRSRDPSPQCESCVVEESISLSPASPCQPRGLDRAADGAAKLVLDIFGTCAWTLAVLSGVKDGVPMKLVQGSMKLICA